MAGEGGEQRRPACLSKPWPELVVFLPFVVVSCGRLASSAPRAQQTKHMWR